MGAGTTLDKAQSSSQLGAGAVWHRWEPHIHAPGTLFNNQFKGPTAWDDYLSSLENATPEIRAIAVTDYYRIDTYEAVRAEKSKKGRLPKVELIFPNIELRLDIATVKDRWTNLHLLVNPSDPEHPKEIERFLGRLRFQAFGDNYACTRDDLIKLGCKAKPELVSNPKKALEEGASQFKVNFSKLRDEYSGSDWASANILIAVAGGETDGTSGIRSGSDQTLRQEVEKFAQIIFASSSAQRDFWLGRKPGMDEQLLRSRYNGPKPCLHGSDAHDNKTVAKPDGDRYSWIKGERTFEALRQTCLAPADRAFVGPKPPFRATPARVIQTVEIKHASWAKTPTLTLNPGLVAIIGARGSGKTALADAIAAGCDATDGRLSDASFIIRAAEHLAETTVRLTWGEGDVLERSLLGDSDDATVIPKARYLSQKFVEELCSARGLKDELVDEIERVIFEAHDSLDRDGATDFEELRDLRTLVLRDSRERERNAIAQLSDQISLEREKQSQIATVKLRIAEKQTVIGQYRKSRDGLVTKGGEERIKRLNALTAATDGVRNNIRLWSQEVQALQSLQNDVTDFRKNRSPMALRNTKQHFAAANLEEDKWESFRQGYLGDVDAAILERLGKANYEVQAWRGQLPAREPGNTDPYVADDANLEQSSLAELEAEIGRIQKLIQLDNDTATRLRTIITKIGEETAALGKLQDQLKDCEGAQARINQLQTDRESAYEAIFETVVTEEETLAGLYRPLTERLAKGSDTLRKMSVSVNRHVDIEAWAAEGEKLFDKRRNGPFKGVGTLEAWANKLLKSAWETGDAQQVSEAMDKFRSTHQAEMLGWSDVPQSQQADYRSWLRRFAYWLYGTDHIDLRYSISYEGAEIQKLSPGTRGIVLLLLYLALDDSDDRPLIIDQPEENLDPKSIFDELVQLFVAAKNTRQVILVTHNANLVVNTDADQIIVAFAGTHTPGELPPISYQSGGLENGQMRRHVCDILEGGERAFRERARRLRVQLER
ncbi:MAG: AAA family ATPase [Hyphomonadaceae bacterium]|nr:AAA family ATPase [Hyphomonadaceae bacterium]